MTTNSSGDMYTYDNVLVDFEGPVATITLNRPERLNALSAGMMEDLDAALRDLNRGDAIRVIRVKGAGRAFCPGYDLNPDTTVYERGTGSAGAITPWPGRASRTSPATGKGCGWWRSGGCACGTTASRSSPRCTTTASPAPSI